MWNKVIFHAHSEGTMFRGRFDHTMDHKGRVSIPSRFRDILLEQDQQVLIVTNFDACLICYPQDEWESLEKKLSALPQMRDEVKHFQRYFISSATECPLDRTGRILIPPVLREYAGLQRDIVFVGALKKMELWSKPRWDEAFELSRQKFGEIANVLADLGI